MDTVTLPAAADLNYDDVVVLVNWMAEHQFSAGEIAYAVGKPWKHRDWIDRAHLGVSPADEIGEDDTGVGSVSSGGAPSLQSNSQLEALTPVQ